MAVKNQTKNITDYAPESVKRSTSIILLDSDDGSSKFTTKKMTLGTLEKKAFAAKTDDYTAGDDDEVITVDATAAIKTVSLPTAVGRAGKKFTVIKIDATNNVVVDADGTETINGSLTKTLTTQYSKVTVISDGANWLEIA